jgi:HEAT repeat protein
VRIVALAAIPSAAAAGAWWWREYDAQRRLHAARVAELAIADQARAAQVRLESSAERAAVTAARAERLETRVRGALARLASDHPMTQCDAALLLARLDAREHVAALAAVVSSDRPASVRSCAASALVTLGDRDTALRAYASWADSQDSDLRRGAIAGFGKVGPPAAAAALPHLAAALRSPHLDVRYLAADSLSKLGPAAVPLLKEASRDADGGVRALALSALSKLSTRQ